MFTFLKAPQAGSPYPRRAQAALVGLLLVFCVTVVAHDVVEMWESRSRAIEQARREAENLTWGSSQEAEGAFQTAKAVMLGLADRIQIDGTAPAALRRLHSFLGRRLASSPMLDDLIVIDADGQVIADAAVAADHPGDLPVGVAALGFEQLRERRTQTPLFGLVYRSARTGMSVIPMSVRLEQPDGSFSGILTATIGVKFFLDFFSTFDLGQDGAVALWRDDGGLLVRQSLGGSAAGQVDGATSSLRYLFPAPEAGTYELVSPLDGVERVLSYRRIAGFPVVVAMALGKSEQLAAWRADAAGHLTATLAATVLLGSLGFWLLKLLRRAADSDQRTAAAAVENSANLTRLSRHLSAARDRAEGASRAKSRFLAGMTHELRTPLNGVLGYAQLLRNEGSLNAGQAGRVDQMLTAGRHLVEMINSVLDLSEIEAGHAELHESSFDVAEVAAACLDLLRPTAAAKNLALVLKVEPGAPETVHADRTRLRQVLLNLLGNAVKFTERGSVTLRVGRSEAGLRIEVADTGPGISPDLRAQLFQEFERLGAEAATVEGAGLGLALSAGLASLMGGSLSYEDNPGGGSAFRLELPLTARGEAADCGSAPDRPAPPEATGAPLRVLVVDDTEMNLDIAGSFLRMAGHAVTCVNGGAQAAAAAAAADFDVILMDVRMPGVDGLEATRRIRALSGPRGRTPVVALTAQAFAEQIEACRQAGMDFHLTKPFTQQALEATLAQAVAASGRGDSGHASAAPRAGEAVRAAIEPLAVGAELRVFDPDVFEGTAAFLSEEAVRSYLRTIAERGEQLMLAIVGGAPGGHAALADAAHTLAGTAGMFGFERTAALARRFEQAARDGAPETGALADRLASVIREALPEMRRGADASDRAEPAAAWVRD